MKTRGLACAYLFCLAGLSAGLWLGCRPNQASSNEYLHQQVPSAKAGNYWAAYNVWDAYQRGKHGVIQDAKESQQWLPMLVKGVSLVRFEPSNRFHPQTPKGFLDEFNSCSHLMSARNSIGGASFFRTQRQGDKLVASFLTESPDRMKADIEANPNLKFLSVEPLTPEKFIEYEASRQESL